jgi:hypothetical protein
MKLRRARLFLLSILLSAPALPRTHPHSPKQEIPTESGYVFALAAANHFLHAWQTGDLESGMVLFSEKIRSSRWSRLARTTGW